MKLPEFLRLRGVRLSNIDSFYFKDFGAPTRWEHGIAVAALAFQCGTIRGLSERDRVHLTLAGLLHDVGTPPFAHTAEHVLPQFDHELAGHRLLTASLTGDVRPDAPIFQSQLPQFARACHSLSRRLKLNVEPDEVARIVVGEGELGFLVNGSLDLDNADNVTRASLFMGLPVDGDIPCKVMRWLATQPCRPTDIRTVDHPSVQEWVTYRDRLYQSFFEASDDELARSAFLEHLMRRGLRGGLDRARLIWATDEQLLEALSQIDEPEEPTRAFVPSMTELVQRYRLMEDPHAIVKVALDDEDLVEALAHPAATEWLRLQLRSDQFEPLVLVVSRRFASASPRRDLLPPSAGTLYVFHLGVGSRRKQLEARLAKVAGEFGGRAQRTTLESQLSRFVAHHSKSKPWLEIPPENRPRIESALEAVGDWGFRLSRNDTFHSYPSTFVHAIPANLLVALGLRDDIIVDPFSGSGQTAIEAVKYRNSCVLGDANTIACLLAKARTGFVSKQARVRLRLISRSDLMDAHLAPLPAFEEVDDWFHLKTVIELRRVLGYIESRGDLAVKTLLRACFSAILPACTARRGEQHGYFADNCPLPSALDEPPYRPAAQYFVERVHSALDKAERLYSYLERQGRDPEKELARIRVVQADVNSADSGSYGLADGSVGGIITSPPYLCMADYTLGHRLSYEWLAPTLMQDDFGREIGARRQRLKRDAASVIAQYGESLGRFANLSGGLVRRYGFVATVLGQPLSRAFSEIRAIELLDSALDAAGFDLVWSKERPIHWHRNHGYARLKVERVSVHVKR